MEHVTRLPCIIIEALPLLAFLEGEEYYYISHSSSFVD